MDLKLGLDELRNLLEENKLLVNSNISSNENIEYLSFDSRDIKHNTLFFCKGLNYKEEYLLNAINLGSICYISEKIYMNDCNYFIVNDIRKSMCIIGAYFYKYAFNNIETIGITGTKGKTTVTYFLKNILDEFLGSKSGVISTIEVITGIREEESHLTTPEPLDLHKFFYETASSNIDFLTMEVTSQAYKMDRVFGVKFQHGMFLNIAEDHISDIEHSDFDDYFNCKLELIKNVSDMVINYNMDYFDVVKSSCIKNNVPYTTYGANSNADYYYCNIKNNNGVINFDVRNDKTQYNSNFEINMLGRFNVENATAAIVMALNMNIDNNSIRIGLANTYVKGRMNVFSNNKFKIIVDYAHNELSFSKLYESIKLDFKDNRIISVGGAPGNKAYRRREDFGKIVGANSDYIYVTAEDPQYEDVSLICKEITKFIPHDNYEVILDRKEAIIRAIENAIDGDIIILLAKGEEDYQKINGEFIYYESDLALACEYINKKI